jgi:hypothetical protein
VYNLDHTAAPTDSPDPFHATKMLGLRMKPGSVTHFGDFSYGAK